MQLSRKSLFTTITTEGAVLPSDLLERIAALDSGIDGLTPGSYHLTGEKLTEAISRTWILLLARWQSFRDAVIELPEGDSGIRITRERWMLPFFQELGYGRLQPQNAETLGDKEFPISHRWEQVPIHLLGCNIPLDKRSKGVSGAAKQSPHSLLQEYLNRSQPSLWGFVSNGYVLRILRDNASFTRQAYVEFDLRSMFDGEAYADFAVLWLLCHQSRLEGAKPEDYWLEKWSRLSIAEGTRALDSLRQGVQNAIATLGRGFLKHRRNTALREALRSGTLSTQDYYRQLLRLIYRFIFLFVAEDRGLLLLPAPEDAGASHPLHKAREVYTAYYSTARIRRLAEKLAGSAHGDIWRQLLLVFHLLGKNEGCPELALPALGGLLFSKDAAPDLDSAELSNSDLLKAFRELIYISDKDEKTKRKVDYRNLGAEELGSVYESLLELRPEVNLDASGFDLGSVAGSERKTTGSYYTPSSLVTCLLDSALDPVLEDRLKGMRMTEEREQAVLSMKVCDPACGSGHFLIAAAHRLAKRLAAIRTGDDEPAPEAVRKALRDVISRCIYGVDINPMAVELCKVSLWLEALEPGKPLSFLDHHIKCGNSLLGATPELLEKGIPDEAFKPIEGDDKAYCTMLKKRNREEHKGIQRLFDDNLEPWHQLGNLPAALMEMEEMQDDTLQDIERKRERYTELVNSSDYIFSKMLADAWCAAFVWVKQKGGIPPMTQRTFKNIQRNPYDIDSSARAEIQRLAEQYKFFHWHLEFPDVFYEGSGNGVAVKGTGE